MGVWLKDVRVTPTILLSKLHIPPIRPEIISRSRLIHRLNDGLERRLTLVSAPAGSGKSTLLGEWAAQHPGRVAWLSLDAEDDDPAGFWPYFSAALRNVEPGLALDSGLSGQIPSALAIQSVLTPVLNEIALLPESLILVLDDYHLISAPAIHAGITFLLEHQPPQLHLVLSSRADPPLPVFRLRARAQLCELRADDLRFTPEEAAAFLNDVMDLDLGANHVAALESRTEGWIVGLQLAALSLQGRTDVSQFVAAFTGSHHYVLEYLTEEILGLQTEKTQRFLLETSILERMCGPLCDALTGGDDGQARLEDLRRRNLFVIPLDDEHHWYRYHHLFADLLGNHLRREMGPEKIRELHRRASAWHASHGSLSETIQHAIRAQDFDRAAHLIQQSGREVLAQGRLMTLLGWLAALPEDYLRLLPGLRIQQAWATFLSGKTDLAKQLLEECRRTLMELPTGPERDGLQGELAALLSIIAVVHGTPAKAIQEAQQALDFLPEQALVSRARAIKALGVAQGLGGDTDALLRSCGQARDLALKAGSTLLAADIVSTIASAQVHQGRLHQATRSYQQVVDLATPRTESGLESPSPPAGMGYVGLAEIALERNELDRAARYVDQGIRLCRQGGIGYNLLFGYGIQAILCQAAGDVPGALAALEEAERLGSLADTLLCSLELAWYEVRLQLLLGNVDQAFQWATGETATHYRGMPFNNLPPVLHEVQQVLLARVQLAQGELERVHSLCDRVSAPARSSGRMARVIEACLLKALAWQAGGRTPDALRALEQALELSAPEAYVRSFIEHGLPMAGLLQQAVRRDIAPDAVTPLLSAWGLSPSAQAAVPGDNPRHSIPDIDPLTERELEVLHLICAGHSNQEISDRLVVSLNTVKKHTSHIYDKLDVTSRAQAIVLARDQRLIPDQNP